MSRRRGPCNPLFLVRSQPKTPTVAGAPPLAEQGFVVSLNSDLESQVADLVAQVTGEEVTSGHELLGIDSMSAVPFSELLAQLLGAPVPLEDLYAGA